MTAVSRTPQGPQTVQEIWASPFGGELFNLYTGSDRRPTLLFSSRAKVVRAMIAAMLEAEAEHVLRIQSASLDAARASEDRNG